MNTSKRVIDMTEDDLKFILISAISEAIKGVMLPTLGIQDGEIPVVGANNMLDKKQAARLLQCSTSSIDNFRRSGKLKAHRIGRKAVRFAQSDVIALADKYGI